MRNTTNHVSMSSEIFSVYALESIRNVVSETPDTGELLMAFILSNIVYLNDSALFMMASLMESEVQSCSNDFDYDWLCNHGWVSFSDRLTGEKEFRVKALSSVTERMRMYDEAKSVMVDNTLNISNEIFDAFAEAALKQAVSKEIGLSELVMAVIDANIQNLGDGALFKMASFMERSIQPTGNNNDDDWVYSHGWTEFSNHLIHEKENRKASFHAEKEFTSDSEEYPDAFLSGGEDSYE